MTVCPLNGNCIYNHRIDTGVDCCGRSACAYPQLQKQQLAGAIAELLAVPVRNPVQKKIFNATAGTSGNSTTGAVIRNHGQ